MKHMKGMVEHMKGIKGKGMKTKGKGFVNSPTLPTAKPKGVK